MTYVIDVKLTRVKLPLITIVKTTSPLPNKKSELENITVMVNRWCGEDLERYGKKKGQVLSTLILGTYKNQILYGRTPSNIVDVVSHSELVSTTEAEPAGLCQMYFRGDLQ